MSFGIPPSNFQVSHFLPSLCLLLITVSFHLPTSRQAASFLSSLCHSPPPPPHSIPSFLLSVYCSLLCHSTLRLASKPFPSFSLCTAHYCAIPPSDLQASHFLPSLCVLLITVPFHPPTCKQAISFLLSVYCSLLCHSTLRLASKPFPSFSLCTAHYCAIPPSDLQASHFLPSLCVLLISMLFSRPWQ